MTVQSAITNARLGATIYLQHKQTSLQHVLTYRPGTHWSLDGNLVSYAVVKAVLAESDISLTPFPISTPEPTSPPRTESMPSPLLPPEFSEKLDKKIAQAVADAAFKCKIDQIGDIRSVVSQLCQEAFFLGQQDSKRFLHNSQDVKEKVIRTLMGTTLSQEESAEIIDAVRTTTAPQVHKTNEQLAEEAVKAVLPSAYKDPATGFIYWGAGFYLADTWEEASRIKA